MERHRKKYIEKASKTLHGLAAKGKVQVSDTGEIEVPSIEQPHSPQKIDTNKDQDETIELDLNDVFDCSFWKEEMGDLGDKFVTEVLDIEGEEGSVSSDQDTTTQNLLFAALGPNTLTNISFINLTDNEDDDNSPDYILPQRYSSRNKKSNKNGKKIIPCSQTEASLRRSASRNLDLVAEFLESTASSQKPTSPTEKDGDEELPHTSKTIRQLLAEREYMQSHLQKKATAEKKRQLKEKVQPVNLTEQKKKNIELSQEKSCQSFPFHIRNERKNRDGSVYVTWLPLKEFPGFPCSSSSRPHSNFDSLHNR